MAILLAGDIGGTKTSLGIFDEAGGARKPILQENYASGSYPGLEAIVSVFLKKTHQTVDRAIFAAAGPIIGGQTKLTNLPWIIDEAALSETFGIRSVRLINDLTATVESIPLLSGGHDLVRLNPAQSADKEGNRAIIAPGTGLGEAFALWDASASAFLPQSSEGGHCDFAPRNDLEADLLRHLREKTGHVSYESICSGLGIQNIYRFLRDTQRDDEPPHLTEAFRSVSDPTPFIIQDAMDGQHASPICRKSLEIFVSVLGAEAGNLALKVLATGGVYIGGGIPRRILPLLNGNLFLQSFTDKGRFSGLLSRIPVHVITHPDAALMGAVQHGISPGGG